MIVLVCLQFLLYRSRLARWRHKGHLNCKLMNVFEPVSDNHMMIFIGCWFVEFYGTCKSTNKLFCVTGISWTENFEGMHSKVVARISAWLVYFNGEFVLQLFYFVVLKKLCLTSLVVCSLFFGDLVIFQWLHFVLL